MYITHNASRLWFRSRCWDETVTNWHEVAFIDTKVNSAAYADDADTIDGKHLSEIFTDLSRPSNTNNVSITIGGITKAITLGARAWDSTAYLPLTGGTLNNSTTTHPISTLNGTNNSADAWNKPSNALLRLEAANNLMIITLGNGGNERTGLIQIGHNDSSSYANIYGKLHLNKLGGDVYINNSLAAHAGNISNKNATIGSSLTEIATIAGVSIKAKINIADNAE